MAAYYIGINVGAGAMGAITDGTSTTSKEVEIVIADTTKVPTREDLILAVEKMYAYLSANSKNW
jgi:hypothetical protein